LAIGSPIIYSIFSICVFLRARELIDSVSKEEKMVCKKGRRYFFQKITQGLKIVTYKMSTLNRGFMSSKLNIL